MSHITLIQGETFRAGLTIAGLVSPATRIEITWRNSIGKQIKKWTLGDGIIELSANNYAYYFTNLETLAVYGHGTWQIEVVSYELGVKKSFSGTYEIVKATNLTTKTEVIIPINFNLIQEVNFTEITPTYQDFVADFITSTTIEAIGDAKDIAVLAASTATTQAEIATTGATTATTQAGIATTQAGIATTQANTANIQAEIATTQASTATTQAGIATTQAGIATTGASTATTQANIATTQASTATTQAGAASTSATNAAASAASAQALALSNATGFPSVRPTLFLDFANSRRMPPMVTFTRNSVATYFDSKGVMQTARINQPRIDFNPLTGECLGLLMEESRINTLGNVYAVSNTIATPSSGISPSGANDAVLVQNAISLNSTVFYPNYGTINNGIYTRSIFVKSAGSNSIIIFEGIGGESGQGGNINFNIITKVWSGNTTIPISYGFQDFPNGWIRIWVVIEKSATKIISPATYYIGGYGPQSIQHNILIWGPQFELGAFITSYIPTTTAAVIRQTDLAIIFGLNFSRFYNRLQGSIYFQALGMATGRGIFSINDATANNRIDLSWNAGAMRVTTAATERTVPTAISTTNSALASYAISVSPTNISLVKDGGTVNQANPTALPTLTQFQIGGFDGGTTNNFVGHIRRIYYYPYALVNSQLQAITAP